jgi:hypothetical protein
MGQQVRAKEEWADNVAEVMPMGNLLDGVIRQQQSTSELDGDVRMYFI